MKPDEKPADKGPERVTITINDNPYQVRPGNHPVAELKTIPDPNIPKEDELSMWVDGAFKALDPKAHIDIVGGEIFASHTPSGGAS